jgi:hypothetical protein
LSKIEAVKATAKEQVQKEKDWFVCFASLNLWCNFFTLGFLFVETILQNTIVYYNLCIFCRVCLRSCGCRLHPWSSQKTFCWEHYWHFLGQGQPRRKAEFGLAYDHCGVEVKIQEIQAPELGPRVDHIVQDSRGMNWSKL